MPTARPRREPSLRRFLLLLAAAAFALGGCGLVVVERDPSATDDGPKVTGGGRWDASCLRPMTGDQAQTLSCFAKTSPADACPTIYQATLYLAPTKACAYIVSVDCGPVDGGEHCCYLITEEEGACD